MDKFKADMDMLVGKKISVIGFREETVKTNDGDLTGVIIDGAAEGVDFEVMTFSKVLIDYLHKVPTAWFPFNTTIVKRTSDAGFDYYAFAKNG